MKKQKWQTLLVVGLICGSWYSSMPVTAAQEVPHRQAEATVERTDNSEQSFVKLVKKVLKTHDESIAKEMSLQREIGSIRYSKSPDKVRIVFDLTTGTKYSITKGQNGEINVDFTDPVNPALGPVIKIGDDTVPDLTIMNNPAGTSRVVIANIDNSAYSHGELNNPHRLFIDINKDYEYSITRQLAPGLTQIDYYQRKHGVRQTGHMVEVNLQHYKLAPVLGGGTVLGKNSVGAMARYAQASVAENASYFGSGKNIYGVTKIAGDLVASMYLPRTAFGILANGKPHIDTVTYTGKVITDKGSYGVAGLNTTRNANGITLYNKYYGTTTPSGEQVTEYVVTNGIITAINAQGKTPIPPASTVVAVTGDVRKQWSNLQVGDAMQISQLLNVPWDTATDVLGVGPRLVRNGAVDITTGPEQIGSDVSYGRAPRTAVGILRNGNVLFAVVDGRQAHGRGMTLTELAKLLINMQVVDAVNFDGGGSSELVINGRTVNSPSDGAARGVATSLVAIPR